VEIKKRKINIFLFFSYILLEGDTMAFSDNFFNKVKNKTNVDKETILSLANKLQGSNMKNENTLREVIHDISKITGRDVSPEKEQKIIDTVLNNKVPNNLDKYLN